jgi:trehalose synthase
VIQPSIDPLAPKNEDLPPEVVHAVLRASGLLAGDLAAAPAAFARHDGTPGRVERRADCARTSRLPRACPWSCRSPVGTRSRIRWVITRFDEHVPPETGAHLVYTGPAVEAVADDPESLRMLREAIALRERLPEGARRRVHLASLPMEDVNENAIIVNALQRHATVVTQKSLAGGFGLTAAEAMWKPAPWSPRGSAGSRSRSCTERPGSCSTTRTTSPASARLVVDRDEAARMGQRARERVRDRFTSVRRLLDYAALIQRLAGPSVDVRPAGSSAATAHAATSA